MSCPRQYENSDIFLFFCMIIDTHQQRKMLICDNVLREKDWSEMIYNAVALQFFFLWNNGPTYMNILLSSKTYERNLSLYIICCRT